jgi:undecaprenyl phosphate N,N'-diacetylbacillosamine 1-phosphate transferase
VLYKNLIKPVLDVLISLMILVISSPILAITFLLLAIANNGNVWFLQERPGLRGKIFRVIKFKTMTDQRDEFGNLLPDDRRLTTIGKFVRKTSLDELPQLINVLKGDMSIVGPRPLLVEYLPLYDSVQAKRHDVKPGITGWAQVNGRNTISWEDKFAFDVWYVKHQSFLLDIRILLLTVKKVFIADGINSNTAATMEKFKGSALH